MGVPSKPIWPQTDYPLVIDILKVNFYAFNMIGINNRASERVCLLQPLLS